MENLNKKHGLEFWEKWFSEKTREQNFREIDNYWERRYYDTFHRFLLKQIKGLSSGSLKVLEAGSGSGEAALRLAKVGNRATLLDASHGSLEFSKLIAKKKNIEANFMFGDLFSIPFPDESFDFTFNVGTIEEYDKSESIEIIKEMKRVTKRSGFVLVGVPNPRNPEIVYSRKTGLWKGLERNYYENDLKEMLNEVGFRKVQISYVPTLFAFGYFEFLKPFVARLPLVTRIVERVFRYHSVVIIGIGEVE